LISPLAKGKEKKERKRDWFENLKRWAKLKESRNKIWSFKD